MNSLVNESNINLDSINPDLSNSNNISTAHYTTFDQENMSDSNPKQHLFIENKSEKLNFLRKYNSIPLNRNFYLNNDDDDDSQINICLTDNCNLKSIEGFDFCYQHIDTINNKNKLCNWVGLNNETCNQISVQRDKTSSLNQISNESKTKNFCLNHIFFEKLKTIRETSTNEQGKYRLIKDPNYELDSFNKGSTRNSLFLVDNNMLSEPKFLIKDTIGAKRRSRRKQMQKLKKNKFNGASAAKKNKLITSNVDIGEDSEGDNADDSDSCSENNSYLNEFNEYDLDLLDSSDSLDQTMFNIIKAKQANDDQLVKKYSLKQNPETNEYVLVVNEEHDLNESDNALSAGCTSNTNSKLIDTNIQQDYDSLLSNAGAYTKEEVVKIFKCKLSKLQLLYKKQLAILNDRLIYDRKKYLVMKKNELESKMSNPNDLKLEDHRLLKTAKKYHQNSKMETYLKQKYDPKLFHSSSSIYNDNKMFNKCIYSNAINNLTSSKDLDKCNKKTLPCSKYCKEHILYEPNQVLFCECGEDKSAENANHSTAESVCKTPIIESINSRCRLHLTNGFLATNELNQMNKLNQTKLNSILLQNIPEHPPSHLVSLAKSYKETYIKKRQEEEFIEEELKYHQLQHEQLISTIIEEENLSADNNDLFDDFNLETPDQSNTGLVRIKQEIIENNPDLSLNLNLNQDQELNKENSLDSQNNQNKVKKSSSSSSSDATSSSSSSSSSSSYSSDDSESDTSDSDSDTDTSSSTVSSDTSSDSEDDANPSEVNEETRVENDVAAKIELEEEKVESNNDADANNETSESKEVKEGNLIE